MDQDSRETDAKEGERTEGENNKNERSSVLPVFFTFRGRFRCGRCGRCVV
jgi:hypothetical protein